MASIGNDDGCVGVSGNAAVRAVSRPPGVLHPRLLHHTEGQAQQRVSKRIEPSYLTMIFEHLCAIMFFSGLLMSLQSPHNVQLPL
jgi:hypothetical protein